MSLLFHHPASTIDLWQTKFLLQRSKNCCLFWGFFYVWELWKSEISDQVIVLITKAFYSTSKEGHAAKSSHPSIGYTFLLDWSSAAKLQKKGCASLVNQWKQSAKFQWKQDAQFKLTFFWNYILNWAAQTGFLKWWAWNGKLKDERRLFFACLYFTTGASIYLCKTKSPILIWRSQRQTTGTAHCSLLTDRGQTRKTLKIKIKQKTNKQKTLGVRSLGTRVKCRHKFSFYGGLLKTTYKDKKHSRDELFLFQAFADAWFSRYITFMTTR